MDRREFLRAGAVGLGITGIVGATGANPLAPDRSAATDADPERPPRRPPTETPTPEPTPDHLLWSHDVRGSVYGLTTAGEGAELYVSIGTTVSRLDAESGDVEWEASSEQSIEAPVAVADDAIFAVGRQGRLLAVDRASGDRRWFEDTGSFTPDRPHVHDGAVVVPGQRIAAYEADSGDRRWVSSRRFTSPQTLRTDDHLYVGDANDAAKLSLADGSAVWTWDDRHYTADLAYNLVHSPDHDLLFGTNGGGLYAVDTTDGELRWQAEDRGTFQSLALVGDRLLYLIETEADNSMFGAIDLAAAEISWEHIAPLDLDDWEYGRVSTDMADYEGDILAGTTTGHLVRLDPESGELRDAGSIREGAIGGSHVVQDRAYLVADGGIAGIDLTEVFGTAGE